MKRTVLNTLATIIFYVSLSFIIYSCASQRTASFKNPVHSEIFKTTNPQHIIDSISASNDLKLLVFDEWAKGYFYVNDSVRLVQSTLSIKNDTINFVFTIEQFENDSISIVKFRKE